MSGVFSLARAGHWFLHSGIQSANGGVARYYRADIQENKPVSTEITGYTASALVFLFHTTQDEEYLDRARLTARFLCECAWDPRLGTFPFEYPSPSAESPYRSYFFDCGIIVRGLLSVWRITREDRLLEIALAASRGMIADFNSGTDIHPILELPDKRPLVRTGHWSRMPGCYQAKSAMAWWETAAATGDATLRDAYLGVIEAGLQSYRTFLPGIRPDRMPGERAAVMDRLHPACYFLEALYPLLERADCAEAYRETAASVACYLRDIAPVFCRSDVYAQLLRARINGSGVLPWDASAAAEEAAALTAFQSASEDPRIDGAFFFGRRNGEMVPHANPVSTAFAIQALSSGKDSPCQLPPI